ncbi:MAG: DNA-binding response regulator [Burkholderiaceae bacterium]|nr:DNA-binding response regulator [Burkholderiaceae bacterium]
MMKIAILLRDEPAVRAIREPLAAAGFDCAVYRSVKTLLDGLRTAACDLLLAGASETCDGQTAVAMLRDAREAAGGVLPALLLIDDADPMQLDVALAADDYLIKPVRQRDLLARVRVLLRRAWPEQMAQGQLHLGPCMLDAQTGHATVDGKPVELTQKEFALALLFFRHAGQPLSRATILESVWGGEREASFRSIDTHVSRVRAKLGLRPANGWRLVPVYGYGYLLEQVSG